MWPKPLRGLVGSSNLRKSLQARHFGQHLPHDSVESDRVLVAAACENKTLDMAEAAATGESRFQPGPVPLEPELSVQKWAEDGIEDLVDETQPA
jgi:hypothetical protein